MFVNQIRYEFWLPIKSMVFITLLSRDTQLCIYLIDFPISYLYEKKIKYERFKDYMQGSIIENVKLNIMITFYDCFNCIQNCGWKNIF